MTLTENLALTQTILTRYILFLCFLLGIIGSFFNLVVFCQKKLRSNSCSVYFIATSIFNVLVILCGITPVLLTSYLPNNSTINSSAFCKARAYVIHVFLMMSRSSVALACVDRFALCSPNVHIRRLSHRRIAILLVIIECILWLIIPIHVIIYTNIQMPGERCGASGLYSIIYSIYAAIVTAIPLVVMVLFSLWALQNLRNSHARIHPLIINTNANMNTPMRIRKRDVQLMTILIGEVIVYFFSTVWFPIYSIYVAITLNTSKTTSRLAIEGFIRYLTLSFLIFLNSCSLFYVHLLTSKAFRQECQQLIVRLFKVNQNNQYPKQHPKHQILENNQISQTTPETSNIRKQLNHLYDHQQIQAHANNNIQMNPLFI
jgi:hypothetical protein